MSDDAPLPDDSAARPGGSPPQPRGMEGARPDTPQPAGKQPPVDAPAVPASDGEPALPPIPEDGPDDGAPPARTPTLPPGASKKPTLPPGAGPKKPSLPPSKKPARPPGAARPSVPPAARTIDPEGDGAAFGLPVLTRKDFVSGADVRWCPGCGDYAVLAAVQRALPDLAETRENVVFISGIGCSSRFPYYMNTYGFHSIHGRAPAIATGLKTTRPELDVWVVTGDGDALSIGAGHTAHMLRRNVDLQVLLFNNQIYGLTKGQYSPTSEVGKVTKSSPYGSLDHPFNPAALALGSDGTFIARTLDRDPKHMQAVLKAGHAHRGTSLIEIYQNCNIFNDGAFFDFTERDTKPLRTVMLEEGRAAVYAKGTKGLVVDGLRLRSVDLGDAHSASDCLTWDPTDKALAHLVIDQLFWNADLPRPFGVLYREDRPTYDAMLNQQVDDVRRQRGPGKLAALLNAGDTWTIE